MAKVKICLDTACVKYIYLEDGRLIHQKKSKCNTKWEPPEDFDQKYNAMTRNAQETMYASPDFFKNVEEGKELSFEETTTSPKQDNPEQEIVELEARLKELKKKKGDETNIATGK